MKEVLSQPEGLARAFSRHVYGMLSWVDIFGAKLSSIDDLDMKVVAARVVADNARHAKLFRKRAEELGENPDTYKPPEIGQRIYDILEDLETPIDYFAYAWGSLIHFASLLDLYQSVADPMSREVIRTVQDDVSEHLTHLEEYFRVNAETLDRKARAEEIKTKAETIYAEREEKEIDWYAGR